MKIHFAIFAVSALALSAAPALAQQARGNAGHSTRNVSGSRSVAIINNGDPSASAGDPGGRTFTNTPDLAISSFAGAGNPCSVGGSLGVTAMGVGVGGAISGESGDCTKRAWYIAMQVSGEHTGDPRYRAWANGIACSQEEIRRAAPVGFCPTDAIVPASSPPALLPSPSPAAAVVYAEAADCQKWRRWAKYYRQHNSHITLGHSECGTP